MFFRRKNTRDSGRLAAGPTAAFSERVLAEPIDGYRNAIVTCMGVSKKDRVFIITDNETGTIGRGLRDQAQEITGTDGTRIVSIEEYGERPLLEIPPQLLMDLYSFNPTVALFAASAVPGEIRFRRDFIDKVRNNGLNARLGHMVGITREIMEAGMAVDYDKVKELGDKVLREVKRARRIKVTTVAGTDLEVELRPHWKIKLVDGWFKLLNPLRWTSTDGHYHRPKMWGNLPAGEVFTCPENVNGTFVVDGVLGDYFSRKYGVLKSPVKIKIVNSIAVSVECENNVLAEEFLMYLKSKKNGTRVGEFAIGINIGLVDLTGNLLQDEKFPGMHMAFGHPDPKSTGADWESEVHIDCVVRNPTILVDGKKIMEVGTFLI